MCTYLPGYLQSVNTLNTVCAARNGPACTSAGLNAEKTCARAHKARCCHRLRMYCIVFFSFSCEAHTPQSPVAPVSRSF